MKKNFLFDSNLLRNAGYVALVIALLTCIIRFSFTNAETTDTMFTTANLKLTSENNSCPNTEQARQKQEDQDISITSNETSSEDVNINNILEWKPQIEVITKDKRLVRIELMGLYWLVDKNTGKPIQPKDRSTDQYIIQTAAEVVFREKCKLLTIENLVNSRDKVAEEVTKTINKIIGEDVAKQEFNNSLTINDDSFVGVMEISVSYDTKWEYKLNVHGQMVIVPEVPDEYPKFIKTFQSSSPSNSQDTHSDVFVTIDDEVFKYRRNQQK